MQKQRFQLSLEIVHCDGFVTMPATAQALYVQIVSSCDDEGFTSQLNLCKFLAHATDEDVKTLIDREFILQVGERKVTVVKHWKMNAWLRHVDKSSFTERSLVYITPNGNYTLDSSRGTTLEQQFDSTSVAEEQHDCDPRTQMPTQAAARRSITTHTNTNQTNTLHTNTNTLHKNTNTNDDDENGRTHAYEGGRR